MVCPESGMCLVGRLSKEHFGGRGGKAVKGLKAEKHRVQPNGSQSRFPGESACESVGLECRWLRGQQLQRLCKEAAPNSSGGGGSR